MIPADELVIEKINIQEQDKKYGKLLQEQLNFLNKHKEELLLKISKFIVLYINGNLYENIRKRTCDFLLLEKRCEEWKLSNILQEYEEEYIYNNDYRVYPC